MNQLINFDFFYEFIDEPTILILRFVNTQFNESCSFIKEKHVAKKKKRLYFSTLLNGSNELAEWMFEAFMPKTSQQTRAKTIIKYGNVSMLKYFFASNILVESNVFNTPVEINKMIDCAAGNSLDMLKYMHNKFMIWGHDAFDIAGNKGKVECMEYACCNGFFDDGPSNFNANLYGAAKKGYIDCIRFALKIKTIVCSDVLSVAIQYHNFEVLDAVHDNGIDIDQHVWRDAAKQNNVDAIEYAIDHNFISMYDNANYIWQAASEIDNDDIIRLGLNHDFAMENSIWEIAAQNNSVNVLNVGIEYGCEMSEEVSRFAALHGNCEVLEYVLSTCPEPDYEFNAWHDQNQGSGYMGIYDGPELTCLFAVKNDHLECLKCAIKYKCTFSEYSCLQCAKEFGSIKCIEYLEKKQYLQDGFEPSYYKSWW